MCGLGGHSKRDYIKCLNNHLTFAHEKHGASRKYVCAVVHSRGGANTEMLTEDVTRNEDFNETMEFIYKKLEKLGLEHNLYGIGVSMGANHLLKYCGKKGESCKFKAVMSFGNPFDVYASMNLMRGSVFEDFLVGSTFDAYFLRMPPDFDEKLHKETK